MSGFGDASALLGLGGVEFFERLLDLHGVGGGGFVLLRRLLWLFFGVVVGVAFELFYLAVGVGDVVCFLLVELALFLFYLLAEGVYIVVIV